MRPTQALFRRIRNFQLTTKQGPKDYYKGTGSGRMGDHTKYGGYIVNYDRVRTYCVPQNLDSFKVCRHNFDRSRSSMLGRKTTMEVVKGEEENRE